MAQNYISMRRGYDPTRRFCHIKDTVSRTIQDAIVDIPSLLKEFNGRLDDLFDKYNNGLVFESTIGVFIDELNVQEVEAHRDFIEKQAKLEAEKKLNDELFEKWKSEVAQKVAKEREGAQKVPKEREGASVSPGQTEPPKSDNK